MAAPEHLGLGRGLDQLQVPHGVVEGLLVDDGVEEVAEVAHIAHVNLAQQLLQAGLQRGPLGGGDIDPGAGGALLALVLEPGPHDGGGGLVHVPRGVHEDEVLAAGLAHDAGVAAVALQVAADGLPHAVEDAGGAREVQPREAGILQDDLADERARSRDEVDHAVRQPGLLEQLHQVVVRQHRGGGRLPHDGVAHDDRGSGQVGADGGEVEWGHREDEALQRAVVHPVPHVGIRDGLLAVDVLHELGVVAEEVGGLAGAVDLRLEGALGLPQHGGGVQDVTVLRGDQAGHLVEDGGAVLPGRGLPGLLGGQGRVDGQAHLGLACLVEGGQHMLVVMGADGPVASARADLLAADDERDLQLQVVLPLQLRLQQGPLPRSRGIGEDGLVVRLGQAEDGIRHGVAPPAGLLLRESGIRKE